MIETVTAAPGNNRTSSGNTKSPDLGFGKLFENILGCKNGKFKNGMEQSNGQIQKDKKVMCFSGDTEKSEENDSSRVSELWAMINGTGITVVQQDTCCDEKENPTNVAIEISGEIYLQTGETQASGNEDEVNLEGQVGNKQQVNLPEIFNDFEEKSLNSEQTGYDKVQGNDISAEISTAETLITDISGNTAIVGDSMDKAAQSRLQGIYETTNPVAKTENLTGGMSQKELNATQEINDGTLMGKSSIQQTSDDSSLPDKDNGQEFLKVQIGMKNKDSNMGSIDKIRQDSVLRFETDDNNRSMGQQNKADNSDVNNNDGINVLSPANSSDVSNEKANMEGSDEDKIPIQINEQETSLHPGFEKNLVRFEEISLQNKPEQNDSHAQNIHSIEDTIIKNMDTVKEGDTSVLKVKLYPKELGTVNVELRMDGDKVIAKIIVDNNQAKQMFHDRIQDIHQGLKQHNIELSSLDIDMNSNSKGQDSGGNNMGYQRRKYQETTNYSEEHVNIKAEREDSSGKLSILA